MPCQWMEVSSGSRFLTRNVHRITFAPMQGWAGQCAVNRRGEFFRSRDIDRGLRDGEVKFCSAQYWHSLGVTFGKCWFEVR